MTAPGPFARVLDRKLEGEARRPPRHRRDPIGTRPFVAGSWAIPSLWSRAGQRGDLGQPRLPAVEPEAKLSPRLTPEQHEALSMLRELGASLGNDFDGSQLKSAFRRLALVLHPDRHPDAGPRDREQLSERFAVLCRAYRTLSPSGI